MNGTEYSGTIGPSGVGLHAGDVVTWESDGEFQESGFKICYAGHPSPAPRSTKRVLPRSIGKRRRSSLMPLASVSGEPFSPIASCDWWWWAAFEGCGERPRYLVFDGLDW